MKVKIPCEDCITLPICIQRYNQNNVIRMSKLSERCGILKKYVFGCETKKIFETYKLVDKFFIKMKSNKGGNV